MKDRDGGSAETTLGATLRRIADAALGLFATRVELASIELAQAQRTLVRWFALCLAAGLLLLLAVIAATAAAVIAFWATLGWLGLILFALVYTALAVALVVQVQREVAASPAVLAATTAELKEDLVQLQAHAALRTTATPGTGEPSVAADGAQP
jgi:uncharacterized membrane protein YqjE